MENNQTVAFNASNALKHLKLMNKLGASFFIMFLISMSLSLADLGEWSDKTLNLYNIFEPTFLMVLAMTGAIVYGLGINRTLGRVISFIFIAIVLSTFLSQVFDVLEVVKSAREARGLNFEFKHMVRALNEVIKSSPFHMRQYSTPPLNIILVMTLLPISLIGIIGGIFSPRFKENKTLNAAITGKKVEITESESSNSIESNTGTKYDAILKAKKILNNLIAKVFDVIKSFYHIIKPLINSLLDKGTEFICKHQTQLKPDKVKMTLGGILTVLFCIIIF
tara:strand:- start:4810 stop:5646 length:837 start_codon:yes stop_codon:yes gene_type:complete